VSGRRDPRPATGTHGEPAAWERAREGAEVELHRREFEDAGWSLLYGPDTEYATAEPDGALVAGAAGRARRGELPGDVHGPVTKPAVWTWEVPLYFWLGGIAAGSSFAALACDLSGDGRSAATARKVALAALAPSPALLVSDLGRPQRFLNMLRVFKPRSPMSMGAWCLTLSGNLAAAAVAADLAGRPRAARALGTANAVVGGYLGSYTGVLLASTAVPVWSRSRLFLGPVFVSTAAATGAAATSLALAAGGLPRGHPTRAALDRVQVGAIASELALSTVNERRLGRLGRALAEGAAGRLFRTAKWSIRAGLALRLARQSRGPWTDHAASLLYLAGGLAFRYAWVAAGRASATDDEAVAATARERSPAV
jgi:formate-dependent nitrite reductase membrane component NrfD